MKPLKPSRPEYSGSEKSLDDAKNAAKLRIGLKTALEWENIGPAIKVPGNGNGDTGETRQAVP